jgi:hypothetical protein
MVTETLFLPATHALWKSNFCSNFHFPEVYVLTTGERGEAATERICHSASGSKVGMAKAVSETSVERIGLTVYPVAGLAA